MIQKPFTVLLLFVLLQAPVFAQDIPQDNSCVTCHVDMWDEVKNSVHSQNGIFCSSCHGGDPTITDKDLAKAPSTGYIGIPDKKQIVQQCGQCHANEKKYFLESPHARLTDQDQFSECVSCHGNHGVRKLTFALHQKACIKCHDADSSSLLLDNQLARAISQSTQDLAVAEESVKQASTQGLFVEDETTLLEEAKTNLTHIASLQHTLSIEKISAFHDKVSTLTRDVRNRISEKYKNIRSRKMALIPIWIFILIMVGALWTKYKELKEKKNE